MRLKIFVAVAVIFAETVAFVIAINQFNPFLVIAAIMAASCVGLWFAIRRGPALVGETVNEFTSVLLAGASLERDKSTRKAHASLTDRTLRLVGVAMLVIPGIITAVLGIALLTPPVRALLVPIVGSKVASLLPKGNEGGKFGPSFQTILDGFDPTARRRGDVVDVNSVKKDSSEGSSSDTPARPELN